MFRNGKRGQLLPQFLRSKLVEHVGTFPLFVNLCAYKRGTKLRVPEVKYSSLAFAVFADCRLDLISTPVWYINGAESAVELFI